tara:strand:+ start:44 stop:679 length:636 start_codon:yes stop_codon:yes gene_type:complete
MIKLNTEQEEFWTSEFADEYILRNDIAKLLPSKINLFSNILKYTHNANSFIEFGANIGTNLLALKKLKPQALLNAVEINKNACEELRSLKICTNVWENSILNDLKLHKVSLTFTCGVLIHINPNYLGQAYEQLYRWSTKYILICEYFSPIPEKINYRGHKNKLFKRDFAGEMLTRYKDLNLINYQFCYKNDNNFPMDNITWFLMEKKDNLL